MLSGLVIVCVLCVVGTQAANELQLGKICHDLIFIYELSYRENYWRGIFRADKIRDPSKARITLRFSAPARVSLESDKDGSLLAGEDAFHLSFSKKNDGSYRSRFRVQGRPGGQLPTLAALYVNGVEVCKNENTVETRPSPTVSAPAASVPVNVGNRRPTVNVGNQRPTTLSCGKRIILGNALITNGSPSKRGDWPWHAAIYHVDLGSWQYKCGGTLISSRIILTAGHCVTEDRNQIVAERIVVRLGQFQLIGDSNIQEFRVYKVIRHEDYSPSNLKNDIAIIKLGTEVAFNEYIQPACLWDKSSIDLSAIVNKEGYVVGFGFNEEELLSNVLSQAILPVVSFSTCLESNRAYFGDVLTDKNFCAGYRNGTSVCNGDSGGGMFFKIKDIYRLRGIVSQSVARDDKKLCDPKHYAVFTDCAQYLDWIESNSN
ncbi:serine protease SSP1-like isoform X2 [Hermetia illucens]|uniref:serine protease SSP1-like isoform X2 n=1 Tax=Hermetia illucens TaxID=343691 RepID=UPI0018CC2026|nr:serine protease SSP1-like isoform X2 [Hermetia illucens]